MNTCATCTNSYDGSDVLRCQLTGKPAEISCLKYEREPGSDDHLCVTSSTEGRGDA
ncbi:MAG: hypothetical protein ACYCZR_02220 [Burkholderiales bacterium]